MRKILGVLFGMVLLSGPAHSALENNKSIGIVAGDPTGISFKYWTDKGFFGKNTHAIDVAAGWKLVNGSGVHLKADYVTHRYGLIPVESGKLPVYYGIGARIVTGGDFGIRIPVGLNYILADEPFEGFLEMAPTLVVVPETKIDLGLGLGVRYRFK